MSPLTQGLNYRSACDDAVSVPSITQRVMNRDVVYTQSVQSSSACSHCLMRRHLYRTVGIPEELYDYIGLSLSGGFWTLVTAGQLTGLNQYSSQCLRTVTC